MCVETLQFANINCAQIKQFLVFKFSLTQRPRVVPRPTLHNDIFYTILDDFLNIRVFSFHF